MADEIAIPMRVYKLSIIWWIFLTLLIILPSWGFFVVIDFAHWHLSPNDIGRIIYQYSYKIGLILLFIYFIYVSFKARVEFHSDRIIKIGFFGTRELLINEIKGFRAFPANISPNLVFEPHDPRKKEIAMAIFQLSLGSDPKTNIFDWAKGTFTDLNAKDIQDEMDQVIHNPRLGDTEEERLVFLRRARFWAKFLIYASFIILFFFGPLFWGHKGKYAFGVIAIWPFLFMYYLQVFKGAYKSEGKDIGVLSIVNPGSYMFFIIIILLKSVSILNDEKILLFMMITAIIYFPVMFRISKYLKTKKNQNFISLLSSIFFYAIYFCWVVISLNCILDQSNPIIYKARVIEKGQRTGVIGTRNYLKLHFTGPISEERIRNITNKNFESFNPGDVVTVYERKGAFGIPWCFDDEQPAVTHLDEKNSELEKSPSS